jgi:small subunit ribosomal protein S10
MNFLKYNLVKNNLKLKLKVSSFSNILLNDFFILIKNFSNIYSLDVNNLRRVFLPCKIKKFCVLRSPFKHKDSREQFEIRLYKEIFYLNCNINFLNKLTSINLPFGVYFDLKIL